LQTCGFTVGAQFSNPQLGPLADNGGPTQTMALPSTSPAVDRGNNSGCAASPANNLDQRGINRPADGNGDSNPVCDIGAYELPGPATYIGVSAPASVTAGSPFNVTVTAYDSANNVDTTFSNTVHFTNNYGSATLPSDY